MGADMIQAGIIGATGYAGAELFRILLHHPEVEKIYCSSVSFEGQRIESVYQNFFNQLSSKCDGMLLPAEEAREKADVVFTALPHGIAEQHADWCIRNKKKIIDLSADFRYGTDEDTFAEWYKKRWEFPEIHAESVYGLPELNRDAIRTARVIGNPGCYVTSATLALLPVLRENLVKTDSLIVDSKSGVTGAGRNATMTNQFCECGESFSAYAVGKHRHQSEIERNCSLIAKKKASVIFTPHLVPQSRGILSTVYAQLTEDGARRIGNSAEQLREIYREAYRDEPFVRVLPEGVCATTRTVRYSNFCDIQVYVVNGGKTLEIISCLDNMIKGASGQAVQNMNLMFGLDERSGISFVPPAF